MELAELLQKHREQWNGEKYHSLNFGDLNKLIELQANHINELKEKIK